MHVSSANSMKSLLLFALNSSKMASMHGICRDLHPPSWDKDFDLGIWDFDIDKALASLQYLKLNNPAFLYYTIQVKYLKRKPYAILIIQPRSIPKTLSIYQ